MPKSEILQMPFGSTRMLSALISYGEPVSRVSYGSMSRVKHSMDDLAVMQIRKSIDDLPSEALDGLLLELPMFP